MYNLTKRILLVVTLYVALAGALWAGDGQIDIATIPYTISSSGSYIVVRDLMTTQTNVNGITINADNVTLDLNGHSIIGPGKSVGSSGSGIFINGSHYNIVIRNGIIRDWRYYGINGASVDNSLFENLLIFNNGAYGISVHSGNTIKGNIIYGNSGSGISVAWGNLIMENVCIGNDGNGILSTPYYSSNINNLISDNICSSNGSSGIYVNKNNTVTGNVCSNNAIYGIYAYQNCEISENICANNGQAGIYTKKGCRITNNTCSSNGSDGILSDDTGIVNESIVIGNYCNNNGDDGIYLKYGGVITNNTCVKNTGDGIEVSYYGTITGNTCRGNSGDGIIASYYSIISGNNCADNGNRGIAVYSYCRVSDNNCTSNDDAGIRVLGNGTLNCIENNWSIQNQYGIVLSGTKNFLTGNRVGGTISTPYMDYGSGNIRGEIIDMTSGGTITATNPYANFRF